MTYRPRTPSLKPGVRVSLQKGESILDCAVESVKQLKNRVGLKLSGIDDEMEALNWSGAEVLLERADLAALGDDEYYHFDIEGAGVYEENGAYVGVVSGIEHMTAHDILNVKTESAEIMIPFVRAIVKSVLVEDKKIIISKIDGLY